MKFLLNGQWTECPDGAQGSLLDYLREEKGLTAAKDGCSGQGACGACLVEVDGKAALACRQPLAGMEGKTVITLEGVPEAIKNVLAQAFVRRGAVQCGFCTPGFLTRARLLLAQNPVPSRAEVVQAVRPHLCRCTGYVKLVDAILDAAARLRGEPAPKPENTAGFGPAQKYGALEKALGTKPFVDDLQAEGMAHGALHFSAWPRARIISIDVSRALTLPGVLAVLTAADVPGQRHVGLHVDDWPVYVAEGEITRCIGDVLACVLAEDRATARRGAALIRVEYEVLDGIFDMDEAETSPIQLTEKGNVLGRTVFRQGAAATALAASAFVAEGEFETPAQEHAFLECECTLALPWGKGVKVFSMSQGIHEDRLSLSKVLNLPEDHVLVELVDAGGGFGGKEDLSTQAHAALGAMLLQRPVKVKLSRPESLRMHPKRHPTRMHYRLGCDASGRLTALYARIRGDAGAYASTSGPVMSRAATHAAGAYHFPHQDIESVALYTNNPPSGAFRGFGVNQVTFAVETLMDDLCQQGGFDRWRFRHDNALDAGGLMPTGQRLEPGMSRLRQCLEALRPEYEKWQEREAEGIYTGLACAIKNTGFGNGIPEDCRCLLMVRGGRIILEHAWTEMGQGLHTVARQILSEALGLSPDQAALVDVRSSTGGGAYAGATTASRGSFLLGHAVLDAARKLKEAQERVGSLEGLEGSTFTGEYIPVTSRPPQPSEAPAGPVFSHQAYSFAAHLALCDRQGKVLKIIAAHDSGRAVNRLMYEGQVEGGVAMGLGFALSEGLIYRNGQLPTEKFGVLGLPRSSDMPEIEVIIVEGQDPHGPLGVKGLGEITAIPSTPAVTAALRRLPDGRGGRITCLPAGAKTKM